MSLLLSNKPKKEENEYLYHCLHATFKACNADDIIPSTTAFAFHSLASKIFNEEHIIHADNINKFLETINIKYIAQNLKTMISRNFINKYAPDLFAEDIGNAMRYVISRSMAKAQKKNEAWINSNSNNNNSNNNNNTTLNYLEKKCHKKGDSDNHNKNKQQDAAEIISNEEKQKKKKSKTGKKKKSKSKKQKLDKNNDAVGDDNGSASEKQETDPNASSIFENIEIECKEEDNDDTNDKQMQKPLHKLPKKELFETKTFDEIASVGSREQTILMIPFIKSMDVYLCVSPILIACAEYVMETKIPKSATLDAKTYNFLEKKQQRIKSRIKNYWNIEHEQITTNIDQSVSKEKKEKINQWINSVIKPIYNKGEASLTKQKLLDIINEAAKELNLNEKKSFEANNNNNNNNNNNHININHNDSNNNNKQDMELAINDEMNDAPVDIHINSVEQIANNDDANNNNNNQSSMEQKCEAVSPSNLIFAASETNQNGNNNNDNTVHNMKDVSYDNKDESKSFQFKFNLNSNQSDLNDNNNNSNNNNHNDNNYNMNINNNFQACHQFQLDRSNISPNFKFSAMQSNANHPTHTQNVLSGLNMNPSGNNNYNHTNHNNNHNNNNVIGTKRTRHEFEEIDIDSNSQDLSQHYISFGHGPPPNKRSRYTLPDGENDPCSIM